jgi:CubicO group peptidase (beta-lactamase class C family)
VSPPAHQYVADIEFGNADPSFDLYGAGGLVSTAEDVARFYEAIFDGTVFDTAASLHAMLQAPEADGADDTGLGIFRRRIEGMDCWGHAGFWGSDAVHCPEVELTIVRTVNQAAPQHLDLSALERDRHPRPGRREPTDRTGLMTMAARVERARQAWNNGDLGGYLPVTGPMDR